MALDFYHGHGSPYSWRVWLALEHKKIPYVLKVLSFQNEDTKKPDFVAINPRHTVPTIVDDGYALWESMAIVEYLDERFTSGTKLYPGDAKNRARIRRLIREMEEHLGIQGIDPITDEFFWKGDAPPDMDKVGKAREVCKAELEYFAKELRGEFIVGDAPCAADYVLAPWLGYVTRIDFRKPEAKLTELMPPAIAAYKKRVEALPYYDKTIPAHWR
jgi:glutathione S-transferase